MFEMNDIEFLLCLFELVFESSNLFLVGGFILFELDLKECELFHGFLNPKFILIEHAIRGSIFWLECLVDVFEFNDLPMKIFKFGFKLISLPFDQLEFLL